MSNVTGGDVARLVVVCLILIGATVLAFVGRIDAMIVQSLYFAVASYAFGYAHGSTANGGSKGGS